MVFFESLSLIGIFNIFSLWENTKIYLYHVYMLISIGAMDSFARGLRIAAKIVQDGVISKNLKVGVILDLKNQWIQFDTFTLALEKYSR